MDEVIPAGVTSQLQELYVAVNRPFKGYLKQLYRFFSGGWMRLVR
jgi:hypothetical protein